MPYDASANTLVCDLRLPARLALVLSVGAAVALLVAVTLPLPTWARGLLALSAAGYALGCAWLWWRRTPARLVITGDGRCRVISRQGTNRRHGQIRGGTVRRSFVTIRTDAGHILVTNGMLEPCLFRRLRARLRTVAAP